MDPKPELKKNHFPKRLYVKPEARRLSLSDEEELLEFCKQKPYDVKDLKEVVNETLKSYGS
jgi:hypothetical protein